MLPGSLVRRMRHRALWRRFRRYTMVPKRRFLANLDLCEKAVGRSPGSDAGTFIECGTWRGGMSFAIATLLDGLQDLHFFDSFQGLPATTARDGAQAQRIEASGGFWHDNNTASEQEFRDNLARFGLADRTAGVHPGWFEETLPGFSPSRPISVLRLDGDWHSSTMTCLVNLYDAVEPGGLILIDDYYDWEGCARAVHEFLAARDLPDRIRSHPNAPVAYILKGVSEG
ncbi:MAG: TylF/MycF family methyltransferase [Alphaproteobacteria bacterium]|nr:TylF/MycF family methyltransferase [Alphaproteobacteria bacterium]